MLSDRIIQTLKFFDLQDYPLTALEVERFLIADKLQLKKRLDEKYELTDSANPPSSVHLDTVLLQLSALVQDGKIMQTNGFYTLLNRQHLVEQRLANYRFGLVRERLIRRYIWATKHLPFVRGVALGGSQAMGLQKATSDIDLLIITDPNRMWVARTFLMAYFQLFGVRRYQNKIANRFCLNHYLGQPREVDAERNLYKAMEYSRLRPLVFTHTINAFLRANLSWMKLFFPNMTVGQTGNGSRSLLQSWLEFAFKGSFGSWLDKQLSRWQSSRIRQDQFVFIRSDELSFHPESKHTELLQSFFVK